MPEAVPTEPEPEPEPADGNVSPDPADDPDVAHAEVEADGADSRPVAADLVVAAPAPREASDPGGDVAARTGRSADARLARVHLRGGMLPLARAALEQMAGAGTLDVPAMSDLAEVRWRNGDLDGASESARAHRASGGTEPLAELIVAEDLARRGNTPEASKQAAAVGRRLGPALELFFAGEPRADIWPAPDGGWMDTGATAEGRWGRLVGGAEVADPTVGSWTAVPLRPATLTQDGSATIATTTPMGRGGIQQPQGQASTAAVVMTGRLAGQELEEVDRSIAAGQPVSAAERLGVLLRLDPALAPIILSAADKAVASAPPGGGLSAIHLVRGDAYRILGREIEAAAAYQQAHETLSRGSRAEGST